MKLEGYFLEYDDLRESDIYSLIQVLDNSSDEKHMIAEEDYESDDEIESLLEASEEIGWYQSPVRYDFDTGKVYTAAGDHVLAVLGDEDTIDVEVPMVKEFGERGEVELDI